jgi:hypothetical protein
VTRTFLMQEDLPLQLTTDLNAVVRSNVNALRRQMTHDHLVATKYVKKVAGGRKQLGWDGLLKFMTIDPQLKHQVEEELAELVGQEGWHLQGNETDYPPISVERLAEHAGVSPRRLREALIHQPGPTPTSKELTLSEAASIAAATNVSLQQLLTPPWGAIFRLDTLFGGTVEYLPNQGRVALDNWMLWVSGLEALPRQNEYVFERNQSFPPEFGERFDSLGRRINKNSRPSPQEIDEFNSSVIFSGRKMSWFSFLNQSKFLPSTPPSQEDAVFKDASAWFRPFHSAFILNGLLAHERRMIRTARKSSNLKRLDKHWIYVSANLAFLLGRLARNISRRNQR